MPAVSRRMSSRRRAESDEKTRTNDRKRRRKQSSPSPPSKRRKANDGAVNIDSGEEMMVRSTTSSVRTEDKMTLRSARNGITPLKKTTNGIGNGTGSRKRKREESLSSGPSDTSSDPLTSAKYPPTPSMRQVRSSPTNLQTPTKATPLRDSTVANGIATLTGTTPIKSFKDRIKEVTVCSTRQKSNRKVEPSSSPTKENSATQRESPSDTIVVNGGAVKSKTKPTTPTRAQLDGIKSTVLSKLTGRAPIRLIGKSAEVAEEIHNVMQRAVQGESNTLLLLGGPGSSKSAIVKSALDKLQETNPDGGYYTIRLDGQIQLDDKIALKEIARQLALGMNVEMEKVTQGRLC
jgi:hypothetical protein